MKTGVPARVPWVRIPPLPPTTIESKCHAVPNEFWPISSARSEQVAFGFHGVDITVCNPILGAGPRPGRALTVGRPPQPRIRRCHPRRPRLPHDRLRSHKMKVTLVREQFRHGDVLDCERVMRGIGQHSMTMSIIVDRCQKIGHACKDRRSELDGILGPGIVSRSNYTTKR